MDKLDREALASNYKGEDELDREALGESSDSCPTDNKCPYCGNTWDSKYTNHSTCGLS